MKVKYCSTLLMRAASVLCGVFLLLAPRRVMPEWSGIQITSYYMVVLGYIVIASISFPKVAHSRLLTTILTCLTGIPFLCTCTEVVASILKHDLAGTDEYTWISLLLVLVLEGLLPLALIFEYRTEMKSTQ
jgi:LytS/YehU family sensor histidine kinase